MIGVMSSQASEASADQPLTDLPVGFLLIRGVVVACALRVFPQFP